MKKLFVALGLVMGGLHVSYAEPVSAQQVPGYYKHQFGNYRITSLLDGTIYLDPKLFKNLSQAEKTKILTKYAAVNEKGVQTSVNAFLVDDGKSLTLVDSGASSCFGPQLGSIAKILNWQAINLLT